MAMQVTQSIMMMRTNEMRLSVKKDTHIEVLPLSVTKHSGALCL